MSQAQQYTSFAVLNKQWAFHNPSSTITNTKYRQTCGIARHSCIQGNLGFLIKNDILYKKGNVLGQEIYKLVLPEALAQQVLFSIHLKNETHVTF